MNYICRDVVIYIFFIRAGKGIMQDSIHFETLNVLPLMHIEKALYGHPSNTAKVSVTDI